MKNIGKTTTSNLCEIFSQILFQQYRMTAYNKFMKQFKGGFLTKQKEDYLPLHEAWTIVPDPPKIMDVNSPLNTSTLKFPLTSRVNPPNLKCKHMVEIHAYSRGVIHSLATDVNMVG